MENKEILEYIEKYQSLEHCHPLTCGVNSDHKDLTGKEFSGIIKLYCEDCGYTQDLDGYLFAIIKDVVDYDYYNFNLY